jgi:hypothetical protein
MRQVLGCATAVAMALALGGCGGAENGGDVSSTPTPNTSLVNLVSSESFANDAASASGSFAKDGTPATTTAAKSSLTAFYDAVDKSYKITVGDRTQTFTKDDLQLPPTDTRFDVYVRRSGSTTDTLTLTRPGRGGRFTYEYVGGGYWVRAIDGASAISRTLDAFAYGVRTPANAVPRSGKGEYGIDLIGVETSATTIFEMRGSGSLYVDFAGGTVLTHGTTTSAIDGTSPFSSEAKLSSSANSFTGNFRLDDDGLFTGTLQGAFYGPGAEEVGAGFSASSANGRSVVGAIIGRGGSTTAENSSLKSATVAQFFVNDAATATGTITSSTASDSTTITRITGENSGAQTLVIHYDATRDKYTLVAPDRSQYFQRPRVSGGGVRDELSVFAPATFDYVNGALWKRRRQIDRNREAFSADAATFGIPTSGGAVPRTGTAGYAVQINGALVDPGFPTNADFSGIGTLVADFGAGTLSAQGGIDYIEDKASDPLQRSGAFTANATISSSGNSFSGTIALDGVGNYTGTLTGRFYGPGAEELGAAFFARDNSRGSVDDPQVGTLSGILLGKADPDVLSGAVPRLDELTEPTTFASTYLLFKPGQTPFSNRLSTLTLDPARRVYTFNAQGDGIVATTIAFRPSDLVADPTAPDFDRYVASQKDGTETIDARVFKQDNNSRGITLSYTGFADITLKVPSNGSDYVTQYYLPYGLLTPSVQLPRFGSAVYNGIIYGRGTVIDNVGTTRYALSGSSQMTVQFGSQTFTAALAIAGTPAGGGADVNLGTFLANGTVGNNATFGGSFGGNVTGFYRGAFYGPNAAEMGGVFSIARADDLTGVRIGLNGVTVGGR